MLTPEQYEQLLKPINPARISERANPGSSKKLAYVEAWDVKAHLTRIFGFGNWSWEVLSAEHMFTLDVKIGASKKDGYHVGYRVIGRLTIHGIGRCLTPSPGPDSVSYSDRDAVYTEAAVGSASLPALGDAHDMAVKTAESDALKRAAICLGDQFGLSLYNGGSRKPVIQRTIGGVPFIKAKASTTDADQKSLVDGVPVERDPEDEAAEAAAAAAASHGETAPEPSDEPMTPDEGEFDPKPDDSGAIGEPPPGVDPETGEITPDASEWIDRMRPIMNEGDVEGLVTLQLEAKAAAVLDLVYEGRTLGKVFDEAIVYAGKVKAGRAKLAEMSTDISEEESA